MKNWLLAGIVLVFSSLAAAQGSVKDCSDCGTVRSVDVMNGSNQTSGKGAILGAVIGGVVGHQFGSGRGNGVATAAGAVGGAAAGNQVEKNRETGTFYRITVDMDSGQTREVNVRDPADLAKGSRVRMSGQNIERLG